MIHGCHGVQPLLWRGRGVWRGAGKDLFSQTATPDAGSDSWRGGSAQCEGQEEKEERPVDIETKTGWEKKGKSKYLHR